MFKSVAKVYENVLTPLATYYRQQGVPAGQASSLARHNLAEVGLGSECGGVAPKRSLRKLVMEGASLPTIRQFLDSPLAKDPTTIEPYQQCARQTGDDSPDPMALVAVASPEVFTYLLSVAGHLDAHQQEAMDLEMGVDVGNAIDKTPLMAAAQFDFVATARMLLAKGAKVNEVTDGEALYEGFRTPLMYAAQSGSLEMIKLLLSAGADRWQADGAGRTALDYLVGTGPSRAANPRLSPPDLAEAARLLY
jgi:hypothetical protein